MHRRRWERTVPKFFPAVLAALQLQSPRTDELRKLTDRDWHGLLEFCDLAHLTLPLIAHGNDAVPAWVRARAKQNLADNRERSQRIAGAYREIAAAFDADGVEHVVMKGFVQYPHFAASLDERMQSDIDLYCPDQSIMAAQRTLKRLGYSSDHTLEKYPADHLPEMTRRQGWQWRGNLYDPDMPPAVDLHYCFWNEAATRLPVEGLDAFWDRREVRTEIDLCFPALSTLDQLAFSALHILRDLLRGDWALHHVYEVAWFLHHHADDELLWETWKRSHEESLRSLQAISFSLARKWFGCRCAPAADAQIKSLPSPVQQWLKRFSHSPLTGMFAPNKHCVWLHLSLLTETGDRVRILGNTLLPLRLPKVGAAGQFATKTRRTRRRWPSQRHVRYLLHVAFRSAFHLQTLAGTLWRGFGWWCAQRGLGKSAW